MLGGNRKTLTATTIMLAFCFGVGVGYWFERINSVNQHFAYEVAELGFYSAFWSIQNVEGADATREEALRGYLKLIKSKQERQSQLYTEKLAATDLALAYARLSILAKNRGADDEASKYIRQAATYCPAMGWQDCSSEKILSVVQQVDKQDGFGKGDASS